MGRRLQVGEAEILILSLYLASLPAVSAATGQVLSTQLVVDHGHRPASYDTSIAGRILQVFDHQAPSMITSHHHRGSTARDRPSAFSHYTQLRSTVNRVYDSKA